MSDDEQDRPEPKTLPPPNGAKDMYSAPTRIGTLPEEVLAAMRDEASDASLAARTSVMEAAALERAKPLLTPPLEEVPIDVAPADGALVHAEALVTPRASVVRSLLVIAIFAGLGGLVAAALTFW